MIENIILLLNIINIITRSNTYRSSTFETTSCVYKYQLYSVIDNRIVDCNDTRVNYDSYATIASYSAEVRIFAPLAVLTTQLWATLAQDEIRDEISYDKLICLRNIAR